MKKVLIGLGVLVVLLIGAALVVPTFIDWNAYRSEIAAEVEKATGRRVTIEGDLELSILPSPAFSAKGIKLGNLEGGSEPDMVSLEEMAVEVALFPLITGDVKVDSIVFRRPVILLESLPDGRANWELGGTATEESPAADGGGLPSISLESLVIEEGTLIWRDGAGGEERIAAINAEISAGSLLGPFHLAGKAQVRGLPTTLDVSVGALTGNATTLIKATLGLPDSGAQAVIDGRVTTGETPSFGGRITARGSNLAAAMAQLTGGADLPPLLGQPFELSGVVVVIDETHANVTDIAVTLGPDSGSGEIFVTFAPTFDIKARLAMPQLDLDKLIAEAKPAGEVPMAEAKETPPAAPATTLLPPDATGSLELAVDAIIFNGQPVRQVKLAANIADDKITLERTNMQLPGNSNLSLSGAVALADGAPGFAGKLDLSSDNLRALLEWLGVALADVPAERLRKLGLSSNLAYGAKGLTLSGMNIELDSTKASGGVAVAMGERLGLGVGLTLDRLNLDAYLPPASGDQGGGGGGEGGDGLDVLKAFDANLDLKIGSLTYQDTVVEDIVVQGTLARGVLMLREGRLGKIAGGSLSYKGQVAADGPALDGTLEVASNDPGRLARLAGLDPEPFVALGPFGLSATLKGTLADLAVNARLLALNGDFAARGRVAGAGPLDLTVTAKHPDLSLLAVTLGAEGVPTGIGGLDAQARVVIAPEAIEVTGLKGKLGTIDITEGTISLAGLDKRPNLTADIKAGVIDLAALTGGGGASAGGQRWSTEPLGLEGLRDLDAKVLLTATAVKDGDLVLQGANLDVVLAQGVLTLNRLDGTLDGGQLEAAGVVDAREVPKIATNLKLTDFNLGPHLAGVVPVGEPMGRLSLVAQLASAGASMADLVGALDGVVEAGGTINLKTGGLGTVGSAGIGLGGKVLDSLLGQQAGPLGKVKNVTDGAALLVQAVADHDTPFQARIVAEDGRATIANARIEARGLTAKAEGFADLRPWTGDIALSVFLNDQPDEPYYVERRVGSLDDPDVARSGLLLQGEAPTALPDAGAPDVLQELLPDVVPPEMEDIIPQALEQVMPEGVLPEGAVPGLIGGLLGGLAAGSGGGDQQPAEQPAEEPAEQPAEEPAEQSAEESAEQPAEEPAEQPAEEPAEQPAEESAEQPAEEPAEQPAEELAEQPAEEPAEQPAEQPVEQSTEQPAEESAEQPAEEPAEQPAEQPAEEPAEQPAEQPDEEVPEQQAEQPSQAPAIEPVLPKLLEEILGQ